MSANITKPQGTVVSTLRYCNVAAAIDWLCNAFGFEKHFVCGRMTAACAMRSLSLATA